MIKKILKNIWIFVKLGRFQKITLHRLNMLQLAFQYVKNEKVPGEYFEFGVARGLHLRVLIRLVKNIMLRFQNFTHSIHFRAFLSLVR